MRAIQVRRFGGPDVLVPVDLPVPTPYGDLAVLDVESAGVNYADTHQAQNDYLAPQQVPFVPGSEVVGRTSEGRRVVALVADGGYAEQALAHPAATFALPDGMDGTTALGLVVQGTTAWHMLRTSARLAPGETVVVHAAAGGGGSLAVQLAREMGARRVIATASTREKRDLALDLGADVALSPDVDDLASALRDANDGRPVDMVLEMTGGAVFDASLAALAPFGRPVAYGTASRTGPAARGSGSPDGDLQGGHRVLAGPRPPAARWSARRDGGPVRPARGRAPSGPGRGPLPAGGGTPRSRGPQVAAYARQAQARLRLPRPDDRLTETTETTEMTGDHGAR
jgi:NADPH2:quinone reductase